MHTSRKRVDITNPYHASDVTFVFGDERLYFVRHWLTLESVVFQELLNNKYKDETEIILDSDVNYSDFLSFLLVLMHKPGNKAITKDNYKRLLEIADKYKTPAVSEKCGRFILERWEDHPAQYLKGVELVAQYRLQTVAREFLQMASCLPLSEIDSSCSSLPSNFYIALLHAKLWVSRCETCNNRHQNCCCSSGRVDCSQPNKNDPAIARVVRELKREL